jgi:hypothetical protein
MRQMIQTVEAVVDAMGRVQLLGEVHIAGLRRALVIVLEEAPVVPCEPALLAEAALSDWLKPEEDAAWSYLSARAPS